MLVLPGLNGLNKTITSGLALLCVSLPLAISVVVTTASLYLPIMAFGGTLTTTLMLLFSSFLPLIMHDHVSFCRASLTGTRISVPPEGIGFVPKKNWSLKQC